MPQDADRRIVPSYATNRVHFIYLYGTYPATARRASIVAGGVAGLEWEFINLVPGAQYVRVHARLRSTDKKDVRATPQAEVQHGKDIEGEGLGTVEVTLTDNGGNPVAPTVSSDAYYGDPSV